MTVIRRYRQSDRDDVYDVCRRTAAAGADATGLYSNDDLAPDVFAGPYLEFEPGLAFVADTGSRVAGYALATADTRAFVDWYARVWLPRLGRLAPFSAPRAADLELVRLGRAPRRMLIPEADEYPAHLHIDLLPQLQGQGIGRQLIRVLSGELLERGIQKVHLAMDPANSAALGFYLRIGFTELPSSSAREVRLGASTRMLSE